jgi:hypothetical protein
MSEMCQQQTSPDIQSSHRREPAVTVAIEISTALAVNILPNAKPRGDEHRYCPCRRALTYGASRNVRLPSLT